MVLNKISAKNLFQLESTEVQLDVNFQSTKDTDDVEQAGGEYIDMSDLQKDDDCVPLKLSVANPNIEGHCVWKFKDLGNGLNYHPHNSDCTSVGKIKGELLRKIMKPSIEANRFMQGKQAKQAVTGAGSSISLTNLPSNSSMYRHQKHIAHEDLQWYTENWGRLEDYMHDLQISNPEWRVVLDKEFENRFTKLFVGYYPNLSALINAGLDVYGLDSCHLKHIIVKGMQLHILVACQGANRNVILAISLDVT